VPSSAASDTELPATIQALPLPARIIERPEIRESEEVEGMSGAMIVTIVLLLFGALVIAVFISRC
jgi:hypothetical protein